MHKATHKKFAEWAEGRRNFPYEDSVGLLTIGIGRNLEGRGLSEEEVDFLYENDCKLVEDQVNQLDFYAELDPVRQMVVFDMVFNMGITRFKGFVRTIEALRAKNYQAAAAEMRDSRWFRQVGRRSPVLVRMMHTGELDDHFKESENGTT